jgi:hypothetical protein
MEYNVSIIYNNGQISIRIGDNEIISTKENLMDRFNGWAYLGFSSYQEDKLRDYNVAFASVCETDYLDEIYYYWLINSQFINGAQNFIAGSIQKLYLGFMDSVGNNVPHLWGEGVRDYKIVLDDQKVMSISEPKVNDPNYLTYTIQVPKIMGNYNLPIQITGRKGRSVAAMKILPKGFEKFTIIRIFNEAITSNPFMYSGSEQYLKTYSWDNLQNKLFQIVIETQDEFGNYNDMYIILI